ncbi:MAG: purine-nucleoside phosphorylase [Spirochaetes bacterium]|nr:MAG: purine-nucleoside phosphorylase [Spirochaetota bacterium]
MSIHIAAKPGEIAERILLPGDPLRAKFIAQTMLDGATCFNEVRNILGYTGTYKGVPVSVMGTGMGIPSISIYVNELIRDYKVRKLIRVGTCGAMRQEVKIRDVILAMSASTDSGVNKIRFKGMDYAPTASFPLLMNVYNAAQAGGVNAFVGSVLSSDSFYSEDPEQWKLWAKFGVIGVEMETSELYTLAAKYGVQALAILTTSDHLVTGEVTTAEERQSTFTSMIKIAMEGIIR